MSPGPEPQHPPSSLLTTRRAALSRPAQRHRPPPLSHNAPSRARRLTLGLCLAASLTLSACGPAHKGQLRVEPARAPTEASASSSATSPRTSSSPPSKAPSAPATWSRPSVTFTNEDTSVWSRNDDLADTSKNSNDLHSEGYEFNDGKGCQGYISQQISEEFFSSTPTDGLDSKTFVTSKSGDFATFQTTSAPSIVEAVRDNNGTMPGYEVSFSGNVNFSDAPNTPVVGYRFNRIVEKEGYALYAVVFCPTDSSASLDQWHTILAGIRVQGVDAGAM